MTQRFKSEEGSILIMTAIALLVLIGFSSWAIDTGILMVGRSNAQNLADGGALAGATARAFDEPGVPSANLTTTGATIQSILKYSKDPLLYGTNDHTVGYDFDCPAVAPTGADCVRVDVYRDGGTFRDGSANGSQTLPTYFANAFGITSQRTRATATAMSAIASGSNCLKPWLIPDKWIERTGNTRFDLPTTGTGRGGGGGSPGDLYVNPGWTLADVGTVLTLSPGSPSGTITPSDYYEIEEANSFEDAIAGCEITKGIGDKVWSLPGHRVGPTNQGLARLLAAGKPVTVVIAMFSPEEYAQMGTPSGKFQLTIVNMLGFRIDPNYQTNGPQSITGTIVGAPGEIVKGGTPPAAGNAFLKVLQLIQ